MASDLETALQHLTQIDLLRRRQIIGAGIVVFIANIVPFQVLFQAGPCRSPSACTAAHTPATWSEAVFWGFVSAAGVVVVLFAMRFILNSSDLWTVARLVVWVVWGLGASVLTWAVVRPEYAYLSHRLPQSPLFTPAVWYVSTEISFYLAALGLFLVGFVIMLGRIVVSICLQLARLAR